MKIGYSKTYPIIGKDQWEKIWIEDEVTGTEEDARKALYALKRQVESFHYESNKAAEKEEKVIEVDVRTPEEKMIAQINEINDIKVLESFELLAKRYPAIQAAYVNKLKQLT